MSESGDDLGNVRDRLARVEVQLANVQAAETDIKAELRAVETELKADIKGVQTEMTLGLKGVRAEMLAGLGEIKGILSKVNWAFWLAIIGAVAYFLVQGGFAR